MTNQELIELIRYFPQFDEDQKFLYESLLKKDLPSTKSQQARELILKLMEEKINLSTLEEYLEESNDLSATLATISKIKRMDDVVEHAEDKYDELKKKLEEDKIRQIRSQTELE